MFDHKRAQEGGRRGRGKFEKILVCLQGRGLLLLLPLLRPARVLSGCTGKDPRRQMGKSPVQVKTGVVRRATKDLTMYALEVEAGERTLRVTPAEDEKRPQLSRALEESRAMVADAVDRLDKAAKELVGMMGDASSLDAGELEDAKSAVEAAKQALASHRQGA